MALVEQILEVGVLVVLVAVPEISLYRGKIMTAGFISILGGVYIIIMSALHLIKTFKSSGPLSIAAFFGATAIGNLLIGISFVLVGVTLNSDFYSLTLLIVFTVIGFIGSYIEIKAYNRKKARKKAVNKGQLDH